MDRVLSRQEVVHIARKAVQVFRSTRFKAGLQAGEYSDEDFSQEVLRVIVQRSSRDRFLIRELLASEAILVSFIRQRALDLVRIRSASLGSADSGYDLAGQPGRSCYQPEWMLIRQQQKEAVQEAVRGLPARERMTILLRYWKELSPRCMALMFDVPVQEVYRRIVSAKRLLQMALRDRC